MILKVYLYFSLGLFTRHLLLHTLHLNHVFVKSRFLSISFLEINVLADFEPVNVSMSNIFFFFFLGPLCMSIFLRFCVSILSNDSFSRFLICFDCLIASNILCIFYAEDLESKAVIFVIFCNVWIRKSVHCPFPKSYFHPF